MKLPYVIYNAAITPDGTLLCCKSNHDYQSYKDTLTGETYMIDGLGYSTRSSINIVPMKHLMVTSDDFHSEIREYFTWKSYGKCGDEPAKYITLKSMTDEHIDAILRTQMHIRATAVFKIFNDEVEYRKQHKIVISEGTNV